MKPIRTPFLLLWALGACAPAVQTPAAPAPAPAPPVVVAPAPQPTPAPTAPAVAAADTAPRDWWLLDAARDGYPGISANRAYRELLAGRAPKRTVTVAIIDSGVEPDHPDLTANIWKNTDEAAGNNRDDDRNGYTDDVRGWNFIGGANGRNVEKDTYEVVRLYAALRRYEGARADTLSAAGKADLALYQKVKKDVESRRAEAMATLQQIRQIETALSRFTAVLRQAAGTDSLTTERVRAIQTTDPAVAQAREVYLRAAAEGITPEAIAEGRKQTEASLQYGLNPDFDPRPIVGDRYSDLTQRIYGNSDTEGPAAEHGTHVAGIIGAERGNGIGIDGIAPVVRLMSVRAVPDGDERDKDIANAIRYAVDNGAQVINMSFGKGYSPQKQAVDEAVRYADSKGVLMVHAAGNDAANLGDSNNFPTRNYLGGGAAKLWIEVGASSWRPNERLVAPFSNYGQGQVDVFAPGVDILSTVTDGKYERNSGTSMASPVVTGLAAMLMAYFPELSTAQVRQIILDSATRYADRSVLRPGGEGTRVPFGELSATGGIVNAYEAVRAAQRLTGTAK